jgi:hypothetical protein
MRRRLGGDNLQTGVDWISHAVSYALQSYGLAETVGSNARMRIRKAGLRRVRRSPPIEHVPLEVWAGRSSGLADECAAEAPHVRSTPHPTDGT